MTNQITPEQRSAARKVLLSYAPNKATAKLIRELSDTQIDLLLKIADQKAA